MNATALYQRILPFYGWVGLVLIVIFWALNWTLSGLRTHWGFFPLWLGYCLFIDGIVRVRAATSLLTRNPCAYAGLFVISIPLWWLFELINYRTQNWWYLGEEHFSDLEYFLLSSLSFSVVVPAVFGTAELVGTFAWVKRLKASLPIAVHARTAPTLLAAGVTISLLIAFWPRYFYPLVWGALYLVAESMNMKLGYRTLLSYLSRGDLRQVVSLALGSLICGFFWEMWNYYSYPKWSYTVPYVGFWHVFEMPLLGYLGYLPFAWELFALYHLVIGIMRRSDLNDYFLILDPRPSVVQKGNDGPSLLDL